jgi:isoquinoline 1-oxidoreductase beta subunit
VPLKNPKDWKLAGKRLARLDTGRQGHGRADLRDGSQAAGMVNAAIKDCPVFGGKIKSVDSAR